MSKLFDELERAAWGGFIVAQSRLFLRIEDDLRRHSGITHTEFEVLLRLALAPDRRMRIQDLASRSLLSRSGTSRAVARLERVGYVRRVGAREDGRGAYAVLTPRGRTHFREAAPRHVALVREAFLNRFSREELAVLADFWQRIHDAPPPASALDASPSQRSKRSRRATSQEPRAVGSVRGGARR